MSHFAARPPRHERLRSRDEYIQTIIAQYPVAPRQVTKRWLPVWNWDYLLWFGLFLGVIALLAISAPSILESASSGNLFRSRYGILLIFCVPALPWWLYTLADPIYRWQKGIGEGRLATATILYVKPGRTSMAVRGTWEVRLPTHTFQTDFLEQSYEIDTWVQNVREGDRIRVLLHPTKDKILLAYGP